MQLGSFLESNTGCSFPTRSQVWVGKINRPSR